MSGQLQKNSAALHVTLNGIRPFGSDLAGEGEAGVELEMTTARGRRVLLMVPIKKISALMASISRAAAEALGGIVHSSARTALLPSTDQPCLGMNAEQAAVAVSDLKWLDQQLRENFVCTPNSPARRVVQRLIARLQTPASGAASTKGGSAAWTQLGYAVILGSIDPRLAPILHSFHVAEWEAAMEGSKLRRENNEGGLAVAVVLARVQYTTGQRTFVRRRLART